MLLEHFSRCLRADVLTLYKCYAVFLCMCKICCVWLFYKVFKRVMAYYFFSIVLAVIPCFYLPDLLCIWVVLCA